MQDDQLPEELPDFSSEQPRTKPTNDLNAAHPAEPEHGSNRESRILLLMARLSRLGMADSILRVGTHMLFIALARVDQPLTDRSWIVYTLQQVGLGILLGLLFGWIGGWLMGQANKRHWMSAPLQQLALRASRLALPMDRLQVASETRAEAVAGLIESSKPKVVILDSIQVMQLESVESTPGSVTAVADGPGWSLRGVEGADGLMELLARTISVATPEDLDKLIEWVDAGTPSRAGQLEGEHLFAAERLVVSPAARAAANPFHESSMTTVTARSSWRRSTATS